jgi:hypothetical protein
MLRALCAAHKKRLQKSNSNATAKSALPVKSAHVKQAVAFKSRQAILHPSRKGIDSCVTPGEAVILLELHEALPKQG